MSLSPVWTRSTRWDIGTLSGKVGFLHPNSRTAEPTQFKLIYQDGKSTEEPCGGLFVSVGLLVVREIPVLLVATG